MITISSLSKSFGAQRVLDGASLTVQKGETLCLLGPSGSGKSTLLRCIVGLETIDDGEIEIDGIVLRAGDSLKERKLKLPQVRRRCGFLFQQFHLFPHRSVLDNVMMAPVHVHKTSAAQARIDAVRLLEQVGLGDKAAHKPGKLSGGEQQRVAIARALAVQPEYLLYDEPTSALDRTRAEEVWNIIKGLRDCGQTQIIVTHQEALAESIGTRNLTIRSGKVVE